jgi:hypothetical protein
MLRTVQVGLDLPDGIGVVLLDRHLQQLLGVLQRTLVAIEVADELGEARALPVQLLGMVGIIPDLRLLELALDFCQPLGAPGIVKGTPSGRRGDLAAP